MNMNTPLDSHGLNRPVLQRHYFLEHPWKLVLSFTSQNFYLGAIPPMIWGTRADHMRPRKVAAVEVRARKRPNWNLFDTSVCSNHHDGFIPPRKEPGRL